MRRNEIGTKEEVPAQGITRKTDADEEQGARLLEKVLKSENDRMSLQSYLTAHLTTQAMILLLQMSLTRIQASQSSTSPTTSLLRRTKRTEISLTKLARRLRKSSDAMGLKLPFVPESRKERPQWLHQIEEIVLDAVDKEVNKQLG